MSKTLENPKIYHITHINQLPSIIGDGCLWCDAAIKRAREETTSIAIDEIKERRLTLTINSRPGLHVGECVPFYFCPRSVMLYIIHCGNHPNMIYRGGQEPIVHLETDLFTSIRWAEENEKRWAFTLSNAGARYFEDRCTVAELDELDWESIQARKWAGLGVSTHVKEGKQAEFLVEESFPWELIKRIGVLTRGVAQQVHSRLPFRGHRPEIKIRRDWYY